MGQGFAVLCFGLCGFAGSIAVAHLSYKLLEVGVARAPKRAFNSTRTGNAITVAQNQC